MTIRVSYKDLVNELERQLSISFTTREDPKKVRRKISMAKHREAIEGKLLFSHETVQTEEGEVYVITAVLTPKRNQVEILGLNQKDGF